MEAEMSRMEMHGPLFATPPKGRHRDARPHVDTMRSPLCVLDTMGVNSPPDVE